jgi:ABC-type antimicrobial peptide transport system permease subunit
VLAGAAAGLAAAATLTRVVQMQLFAMEPTDPGAIAAATVILLAVASIAAYLPALRASRINPLTALRRE